MNQNTVNICKDAVSKGTSSGMSGALAMSFQIISLMWLHTTMTFEYKFGGQGILKSLKYLKSQGGIRRFYCGLGPALLQGPLGRFGDTAASTGVLTFFKESGRTSVPIIVQTSCASGVAGLWRILLMPLNTIQTMKQVNGKNGLGTLRKKLAEHGPRVLFHGASGEYFSTTTGHLLWFGTYNVLNYHLPRDDGTLNKIVRNGSIGICSAIVTDCCTNWMRVIKTYRQSSHEPISYQACIREVMRQDGGYGVLTRGLKTRLTFSCLQGFLFSIIWNAISDRGWF